MQLARLTPVHSFSGVRRAHSDRRSGQYVTNRHLTLSPCIQLVEVRPYNSQTLRHTPAIGDFLGAKIAFALLDQLFGDSIGSHHDNFETRVALS
jgi:hypothetical protein